MEGIPVYESLEEAAGTVKAAGNGGTGKREAARTFLGSLATGQAVMARDFQKKFGLRGPNYYSFLETIVEKGLVAKQKVDGRVVLVRA